MIGEGERLEALRRKTLLTKLLTLAAIGAAGGFVAGFLHGRADATGQPMEDWAKLIALGGILVATLGGLLASWRFYRRADEVEIADNLWASLVGFYVYGFSFPAWWTLSVLGYVAEPNQFIIYGAAMVSAAAAYAVRRWQ